MQHIKDGLTNNQRYYQKHKQQIRITNDLLGAIRLSKNVDDIQLNRVIKAMKYYHESKHNKYINPILDNMARKDIK